MANMYEINSAIEILTKYGLSKDKITVLHCNTEYPTPMEDVNLKAMLTIGKEFNTKVDIQIILLGLKLLFQPLLLVHPLSKNILQLIEICLVPTTKHH